MFCIRLAGLETKFLEKSEGNEKRSVGLEKAEGFGLRDAPEGQELGRGTDEGMMR